ncbi:hypothetical protein OAJ50_05060 [Candidatus Nitrosopelagicus sp.]|nr:hypothetical protein [Candidatus Nitrosopelagicus sp.]
MSCGIDSTLLIAGFAGIVATSVFAFWNFDQALNRRKLKKIQDKQNA